VPIWVYQIHAMNWYLQQLLLMSAKWARHKKVRICFVLKSVKVQLF
jgi:hypothetical protein